MTNEPEAPTGLGPLEDSIMQLLWAQGEGTVGWVAEHLDRHKQPAYTTVMTVMSRLTTKGLLKRRLQRRAYVYHPSRTKEEFIADSSRAQVRALVRDFGDVALAHFTHELEQADPRQLERLRDFLKPAEPDGG